MLLNILISKNRYENNRHSSLIITQFGKKKEEKSDEKNFQKIKKKYFRSRRAMLASVSRWTHINS